MNYWILIQIDAQDDKIAELEQIKRTQAEELHTLRADLGNTKIDLKNAEKQYDELSSKFLNASRIDKKSHSSTIHIKSAKFMVQ